MNYVYVHIEHVFIFHENSTLCILQIFVSFVPRHTLSNICTYVFINVNFYPFFNRPKPLSTKSHAWLNSHRESKICDKLMQFHIYYLHMYIPLNRSKSYAWHVLNWTLFAHEWNQKCTRYVHIPFHRKDNYSFWLLDMLI